VLSPLFNITETNGTNLTEVVFVLPINEKLYTEVGRISQACSGHEISCEWLEPNTLEFKKSGCAVSRSSVDMGSGVVGTECTCTHLTVFAIVLRSELHLAPLCHAQEVDYVLIALYGVLSICLCIQLVRLVIYKLSRISVVQHAFLLLVCALRIAYLIAKPVITSLAGLVALGLLPSAVALGLFIYLLLTWVSLQFTSLGKSPFGRFRVPFATVIVTVLLLVVAIVVAIAAVQSAQEQIEVVTDGSYVLAALYAVVCALALLAGFGLRRTLASNTSAKSSTDWRALFRSRVLITTVALSFCLFLVACLWAAAVQTDIVTSLAATLGTSTAFYVFDWLSLCVMTWLFSKAVGDGVRKKATASTSH